jgi:hypothetical protein
VADSPQQPSPEARQIRTDARAVIRHLSIPPDPKTLPKEDR